MNKKLVSKTILFHRLTVVTVNGDTVIRNTVDCKTLSEYADFKRQIKSTSNTIIESDDIYEQTFKVDPEALIQVASSVSEPKLHVKRGSTN